MANTDSSKHSDTGSFTLTLTLVYSSGSSELTADGLGELDLVVWVHGFDYQDGWAGRMTVMEPHPGAFRQRVRDIELNREELHAVVDLIQAAGLPDASPRISKIVETSFTWSHFQLGVVLNDRRCSVDLEMNQRGFDGAGAQPLKNLFRALIESADLKNKQAIADLTE